MVLGNRDGPGKWIIGHPDWVDNVNQTHRDKMQQLRDEEDDALRKKRRKEKLEEKLFRERLKREQQAELQRQAQQWEREPKQAGLQRQSQSEPKKWPVWFWVCAFLLAFIIFGALSSYFSH